MNSIIALLCGLVVVTIGADVLVRGASRGATRLGVSPLVVGLTVVAFGTSAPEVAISIRAVLEGQSDVSLGNVVGSNVFNVLFILGLSAVITPLVVAQSLVRLEVPILIVSSFAVFGMAYDGNIVRWEGLVLLAALAAYLIFTLTRASRSRSVNLDIDQEELRNAPPIWVDGVYILIGLVMLAFGADWLVDGATGIAHAIGLSDLVISLTVVAIGTSIPEVATSVAAAMKGQRDMAVGNAVGSCIFNLLLVLGAASVVGDGGLSVAPAALYFDMPVMIASAIACLPIFFTGNRIGRREGGLLFLYYLAYSGFTILDAQKHDAAHAFAYVMGTFVLPLTAVTLAVLALRYWRGQRRGNAEDSENVASA